MNIAITFLFLILGLNAYAFDEKEVRTRMENELARLSKNLVKSDSRPKYKAATANVTPFKSLNLESAFGTTEDKIKLRQAAPQRKLKKRTNKPESKSIDIFSKDLE